MSGPDIQTKGRRARRCAISRSRNGVLPGAGRKPVGAMRSERRPAGGANPATSGRTVGGLVSLAAAAAAVLLLPATAAAHHILGLPHYSYKENYPQAPTLEYPAATGPYDVLMTSFPGCPLPGERTTIAFYIKDRASHEPYARPVSLRVLRTSTFGGTTVILEPTLHEPATNQHKFFVTFPEDGEYVAELTMDVEGRPEVIPFLMVAGEPSAAVPVLASAAVGLAVFLVVVRAMRIKRHREAARRAAEVESSTGATTA